MRCIEIIVSKHLPFESDLLLEGDLTFDGCLGFESDLPFDFVGEDDILFNCHKENDLFF